MLRVYRCRAALLATGRTPEDVVLVVLVGFSSHFYQTREPLGHHKFVHQVLVILKRNGRRRMNLGGKSYIRARMEEHAWFLSLSPPKKTIYFSVWESDRREGAQLSVQPPQNRQLIKCLCPSWSQVQ